MAEDWRTRAACQGTDLSVFFPARDETYDPAARLCGRCPVRGACLAEALRLKDTYGYRGGKTGEERWQMLPPHPSGVKRVPVHDIYGLADRGWGIPRIAVEVGVHRDSVRRVLKARREREEAA